jgi:agmatinase
MSTDFNPNSPAMGNGVFGLPEDSESAKFILIPVPWEMTVSYGSGTAIAPHFIKVASAQVDLYHPNNPDLYKEGIFMDEFPDVFAEKHEQLRMVAEEIIENLGVETDAQEKKRAAAQYIVIEKFTEEVNHWLKERIRYWQSRSKVVGIVGGDHSVPLAYHQLLADQETKYGILTIDAHHDLREAYEGFRYSHASIFFNVLKNVNVSKLVQIGIRDYCHEEVEFIQSKEVNPRVDVYYDHTIRSRMFGGERWDKLCKEIVDALPEKVYVSIDIDGLDTKLCPNTGTPVPGGLEYQELTYLLDQLKLSGKQIIGFDLCEVGYKDNDWDVNVGARLLYHLCSIC